MSASRTISLEFRPASRLDIIDVNALIRSEYSESLAGFKRALYCSYHTTAGYFEPQTCRELRHSQASVEAFVRQYKALYPEGAGYRHDRLEERSELTEEQKKDEPLNADAHLTFIGSGLTNCVSYECRLDTPAFFVDLDGMNGSVPRTRKTTVTGYNDESVVSHMRLDVPASRNAIDSLNLRDERLGIIAEVERHVQALGVESGRVEIRLTPDDQHAGITVNEYETLLMTHDLAEVLRNPFKFVARSGYHALRDPLKVPNKAMNYARYDVVVLANRMLDELGLRGTLAEKIVDRFIGGAASRQLHMKRSVSLPIFPLAGKGRIVQGTYQSPILVQWKGSSRTKRTLDIRVVNFH